MISLEGLAYGRYLLEKLPGKAARKSCPYKLSDSVLETSCVVQVRLLSSLTKSNS